MKDKNLGIEKAVVIDALIESIEKNKLKAEQIIKIISTLNTSTRRILSDIAKMKGKKEIASEIDKANKMLEENMVELFKQAVANGTHEEFLSTLKSLDKIYLKVRMRLYTPSMPGESPLTKEEKMYAEIIDASVRKDFEKRAKEEGFASVADWARYHKSRIEKSYSSISEYGTKPLQIKSRVSRIQPYPAEIINIRERRLRLNDREIDMLPINIPKIRLEDDITQMQDAIARRKIEEEQVLLNIKDSAEREKMDSEGKINNIIEETDIKQPKEVLSNEDNLRDYINSLSKTLTLNKVNFGYWLLDYKIFESLLSSSKLTLKDINKFAKALECANVECVTDDQHTSLHEKRTVLSELTSILSNQKEIELRQINRINIVGIYQEIVKKNSKAQPKQEQKRKR